MDGVHSRSTSFVYIQYCQSLLVSLCGVRKHLQFVIIEVVSKAPKQSIMPGYDTRTVGMGPMKVALICPECSLLLRDAVQMGDGLHLCESCYTQLYQ